MMRDFFKEDWPVYVGILLALTVIVTLVPVPKVHAQSTFTPPSAPLYRMWQGRLTGTPTNICGADCYIVAAIFSTNGSTGTITVSDAGTACSSGACNFANAIAIAANTEYEMFKSTGAYAPGGIVISGSGTVDVHIVYTLQGGAR